MGIFSSKSEFTPEAVLEHQTFMTNKNYNTTMAQLQRNNAAEYEKKKQLEKAVYDSYPDFGKSVSNPLYVNGQTIINTNIKPRKTRRNNGNYAGLKEPAHEYATIEGNAPHHEYHNINAIGRNTTTQAGGKRKRKTQKKHK